MNEFGATAETVVEVDQLTRCFGAKRALDRVSLGVRRGQVFGVVGENGAGKTTLIKHLLGQYRAETGSVEVFGKDPVKHPEQVLGRIGYLSEEPELPAWMTVSDLLSYSRAFYDRWDDAYARDLVRVFELDLRCRVKDLSKGKRAQAGLCIAQAHRPDLLLLDEPSSGLDPIVRRDILAAIIRTVVDEGRTVIFSSHLLDEVERVSDHLLMLSHGEVLLSDSMENVLTRHHRVAFRFDGPVAEPGEIQGVISASNDGPEGHLDFYGEFARLEQELRQRGAAIVSHRSLSLNDVFVARSQPRPALDECA
ncbi:MAG: ABC transporter ATP-binding protein [Pseudomonadota bacterium]